MSKLKDSGLGVYNNYGPRTTDEGRAGQYRIGGSIMEAEFDLRGDANAETTYAVIPAGSKVLGVMASVSEAFDGVTAIALGTAGSEASDGVAVPVALGKSELTAAGSWADVLAADTEVGVVLTGTKDGMGNAKVVVRYSTV